MASVHEILTDQFRRWESRGRGWRVFDEPVAPEPPFMPFDGHFLPDTPVIDDGRRDTVLSSFVRNLSNKLRTDSPVPPIIPTVEAKPEPQPLIRDNLIEFQVALPVKLDVSAEAFQQFISNL